jgi:uncharacterized protein YraI
MSKQHLIIVLCAGLLLMFGLAAAQDGTNARVKSMATTLRLRESPSVLAATIVELSGGTPLNVIGRTAGGGWFKVEAEGGLTGWVATGYVELFVGLSSVPILYEGVTVSPPLPPETADTPSVVPVADAGETGGARVGNIGGTLRLRQSPTTLAAILKELLPGTPLDVLGRSEDGAWLNVTIPDGTTGWVSAMYVVMGGGTAPAPVTSTGTTTTLPSAAGVRGVRAIYARGQALGNQRNVFTKIGDSMTASTESLDAIGRGIYTLGAYGSLQRVIDTFNSGFNSFTHVSAAAGPGWTTMVALEPRFRNTAICQTEISSVECELDRVKPAVALIQLGTNDMQYISADVFAYNLTRIVDICIDKGVVPVLATIPYREGFGESVDAFNNVIRGVAASRDIPVWDVKAALDGLPNRGLSGDGIHPSSAPGGYADSANFANSEALRAGYVARNLAALQILNTVLNSMG